MFKRIDKTVTSSQSNSTDDEETASCLRGSLVEKTAVESVKPTVTRNNVLEGDRPRITLDETLLRYGRWNSLRYECFFHGTMCVVAQLHLSTRSMIKTALQFKTRQSMKLQSPACWCDNSYTQEKMLKYAEAVTPDDAIVLSMFKLLFLIFGLSSFAWERTLGRRSSLIMSLSMSTFCTLLLYISANPYIRSFAWTMEYVFSGLVYMIAYTSFIEILPKKWRVAGAGIFLMATAFSDWLALTSSHVVPNANFLLFILLYKAYALIYAFISMKESISHLIVQGKYTEADDMICAEEIELTNKKIRRQILGEEQELEAPSDRSEFYGPAHSTEGDISKELRTARMITDDLAYRDDDDYTPMEFLRKLPSSNVFYLLIAAFTISSVSGVLDRMTVIYLGHLYIEGEILVMIKILIRTLSAFVICFHRKVHRCRSMILLLALSVLMMCVKVSVVKLETSTCSNRRRVSSIQLIFAVTVISMFHIFAEMLRALSLLFVAELSPSVLRMSIITLVLFFQAISKELSAFWSTQDDYKSFLISAAVLVILCFLLNRKVTDSPEIFCIYLNDLVPKPPKLETEQEEEDDGATTAMRDSEIDRTAYF